MATQRTRFELSEAISSLKESSLALLDGGLATHLEDSLGQDLSSSPLWSASLLQSEKGSKAIIQAHLDFLHAGADIISTSSYQASHLAYQLAGEPPSEADDALIKSVTLADEAIKQYLGSSSAKAKRPLILLSLGPYGAALANGSEYTGDYRQRSEDNEETDITAKDLEDFHFDRVQVVARDVAVWQKVDLIAFETIPRLDEAIAIRKALNRLSLLLDGKFSYISFVFPNGVSLPWPASGSDDTLHMRGIFDAVFGQDEDGLESPFNGIGINCTKPKHLRGLIGEMTTALESCTVPRKPFLFLYPDGGFDWDGYKREWRQNETKGKSFNAWRDTLIRAAKEARLETGGPWRGCILGGCCKATASDIAALRVSIDARTCKDSA